jgi:prepilin-type N-terminal cleavage/methylation domain-containing protein
MKFQKIQKGAQKGFTLIELVIAVVVIGFMALIMTKQFGANVSNGAKAAALYEGANKLTNNWMLLAQTAGTSSVISSSVIPAASSGALDVLIGGRTNVASAYQQYWDFAGLSPLRSLAQGSAGSYTIAGYTATLGGGGSSPLSVAYATVPDEIVLQLVQKYGSGVSALVAAGDSTNANIQYGAPTAGARTITIYKQL